MFKIYDDVLCSDYDDANEGFSTRLSLSLTLLGLVAVSSSAFFLYIWGTSGSVNSMPYVLASVDNA